MAKSIIEFTQTETSLLIKAFEDRIQMTEKDFSEPDKKVSKSNFNRFVTRYKEVLIKIRTSKKEEYDKKEKLPIVSCTNEFLYTNQDKKDICNDILKKCGYLNNKFTTIKN